MDNRKTIIQMLRMTGRTGIDDLIAWMDENGFFDAPCSSKYHLAQPGGLAEHSLNVHETAITFAKTIYMNHAKELTVDFIDSIVICSLLHDLGKAGQFGKPAYIPNPDLPFDAFVTNKNMLYVPHEVRSVAIASRFIELTEEEQFAILYHNGLYGELKSFKGNETPLLLILHFADMWAARVIEKEETK